MLRRAVGVYERIVRRFTAQVRHREAFCCIAWVAVWEVRALWACTSAASPRRCDGAACRLCTACLRSTLPLLLRLLLILLPQISSPALPHIDVRPPTTSACWLASLLHTLPLLLPSCPAPHQPDHRLPAPAVHLCRGPVHRNGLPQRGAQRAAHGAPAAGEVRSAAWRAAAGLAPQPRAPPQPPERLRTRGGHRPPRRPPTCPLPCIPPWILPQRVCVGRPGDPAAGAGADDAQRDDNGVDHRRQAHHARGGHKRLAFWVFWCVCGCVSACWERGQGGL